MTRPLSRNALWTTLLLATCVLPILGCLPVSGGGNSSSTTSGSDGGIPYRSTPIGSSAELAGGAWTIGSLSPSTAAVGSVTGFYGALSASGTAVSGDLSVALYEPFTNNIVQLCYGSQSAVHVSGTAAAGQLTLDGDFGSSHMHLSGQLSADHAALLTATYTVTGACATAATSAAGASNPPLNGTYTGDFHDANGVPVHIAAALAQDTAFNAFGQIPLSGTLSFTVANCTVTEPITNTTLPANSPYAAYYVLGSLSTIGYSAGGYGTALNLGLDGEQDQTSTFITLDDFYLDKSTCGSYASGPSLSGHLTRQ